MIFPELQRRWKQFNAERDRGELLSLDLKTSAFVDHSLQYLEDNGLTRYGNPAGAWTNESVTRETALSHSAMWACYCLICESVGALPADLKIQEGVNKRVAVEHPMYSGMQDTPDGEMTAQVFREMLTGHCLLEGDAYAKIIRRSGRAPTAIELQALLPHEVRVDREKQGQKRKVYVLLNERGYADKTYTVERGKPHEIFHLQNIGYDGRNGYSLLKIGRQIIATALANERHVSSFWANGGRRPYLLERTQKFATNQDFEKWRKDWKEMYRDPSNAIVIEDGTKHTELGTTMVESQALESRQHAVTEFCRLTGATPHLVGQLAGANYSITEQLFLEFKTITLRKWTRRWEQAFNLDVLTPEERAQRHFLKLNLDAFLQADFRTRMDGYATALQNGFKNVDEVRDLEDENPLQNGAGQAYHIQLNMGTIPGTGTPTVTEQALLDGKVNSLRFGDPQKETPEPPRKNA